MRAMILAAGRGQRLMPLTAHTPKPLVPVLGKPMIQWQVEKLAAAGFEALVVNLSWLGEQIRDFLGDGSRFGIPIHYSEEPRALETAGGIRHALPLLGEHFAVVNADIFTDYDYRRLRRPVNQPHLVLVPNPPDHDGDFSLRAGRPGLDGRPLHTFAGLAVYPARFFSHLPDNQPLPLRPLLLEAMRQQAISAELHSGRWFDLGSAERLQRAERILKENAQP